MKNLLKAMKAIEKKYGWRYALDCNYNYLYRMIDNDIYYYINKGVKNAYVEGVKNAVDKFER